MKLLKSYAVDFQCMLKGNNSVSSLIFKGQVASVFFAFGLVSKARLNVSHGISTWVTLPYLEFLRLA